MMAADTQVTYTSGRKQLKRHERKIYRLGKAVVGAAGDVDACDAFVLWWPKRNTTRLQIPKGTTFAALVLMDKQIFRFEDTELIQVVTNDVASVGSGSKLALAAMDTMKALGKKPDPRVAVCVASQQDLYTGGTIEWLRAAKSRSK